MLAVKLFFRFEKNVFEVLKGDAKELLGPRN